MKPLLVLLALAVPPAVLAADPVDYTRDIKPLLKDRCFACHGALKQQGKLRLDTAAAMRMKVIVPGDPDASRLLERVTDTDDSTRMPPQGKPLTKEQVTQFREWIKQGAKAPANETPEQDPRDHWAFQPVRRPEVPASREAKPSANPVDAFLQVEWSKRNLVPSPPTDKATLLRRVYLDLVGLPPTRDELQAFLTDDSPDVYEKVVDKLLASPAYGERWARHWMDVWRYSDWYGRRGVPDVLNSYGMIWRWRDWIVRSVTEDRGYDWMVRMMLAADELAPTDDANLVATGFVVRNFFRWNYNNWMRDNVEHTAKAFLGLTFNCAHCHDHKYDPIRHEDYFKFRAFFEPIEIRHDRVPGEPDPGPYPKYSYGAAYKPITSGMVRVFDEKPDAATHFYNGGDERNKVEGRTPIPPGVPAFLGGASFKVEAIALPPEAWYPGLKPFVRAEELAKREKLAEELAKQYVATKARELDAQHTAVRRELAALKARIAADDVAYLGAKGDPKTTTAAAANAERDWKLAEAESTRVKAEVALTRAIETKTPADKRKPLEAQLVAAKAAVEAAHNAPVAATYTPLSPHYTKASSGRRTALANWIASSDNPLTARVAVNHIWNWHFGRPLVETTNNFGRSGKAPTHPELLDWLASELVRTGWKTKPLHRLIVTSQAYRLSSKHDPRNAADPDNVYLWRFPTQRMDAEVVRDCVLAVAGELDATLGGPDLPHEQGLTSRRRSLYFAYHGESRMQFLDLFDAANPCDAYRRGTSVLPQQALALSNNELVLKQSQTLTAKLTKTAKTDDEFVRVAFEVVLTRPPREAELTASLAFLARQAKLFEADGAARARANFVLALFNHTDFVTIR